MDWLCDASYTKGVSFDTIQSLGAQGVYDMHRDAVADGQIYGPSPKYAGNLWANLLAKISHR